MSRFCCLLVASMLFYSCGGRTQLQPEKVQGGSMTIKVTSTAFQEGGMIPQQYTCDGANISPPLSWTGVPGGVKTLALITEDPDAPKGVFTHWVLFNLPASSRELPENVPAQERLT